MGCCLGKRRRDEQIASKSFFSTREVTRIREGVFSVVQNGDQKGVPRSYFAAKLGMDDGLGGLILDSLVHNQINKEIGLQKALQILSIFRQDDETMKIKCRLSLT